MNDQELIEALTNASAHERTKSPSNFALTYVLEYAAKRIEELSDET